MLYFILEALFRLKVFKFFPDFFGRVGKRLDKKLEVNLNFLILFFYLGFLSQKFTIHRTAGEQGGYFFNSSLPFPPASQTLRH